MNKPLAFQTLTFVYWIFVRPITHLLEARKEEASPKNIDDSVPRTNMKSRLAFNDFQNGAPGNLTRCYVTPYWNAGWVGQEMLSRKK